MRAIVNDLKTQPTQLVCTAEALAKKNDTGEERGLRSTRSITFPNTGPIFGRQERVISPIRRLNIAKFEDKEEIKEILAGIPPTNTNCRSSTTIDSRRKMRFQKSKPAHQETQ